MKLSLLALYVLLLTPLTGAAQQQIYKTTDEQGNTVFTNLPPTDEATPVPLQSPNIADSVKVRPHQPTAFAPARANPSPAEERAEDEPVYIGVDDNRRKDVIDPRKRRELRDRVTDGEHTPEHSPTTRPAARPLPAGSTSPHSSR
ncbi:MAG: hypothetical protein ACI9NT_000668 [Bacteroidia bacterium]|jgi:hypothetical protein